MVEWTSPSDLDDEQDLTGAVTDSDGDHPGSGTLAQGLVQGNPTPGLHDNGLVEWWPLNASYGEADDLSGSGYSSTVNGTVANVFGVGMLSGRFFDGSDDYVDVGFGQPQTFTLAAWIYPLQLGTGSNSSGVIEESNGISTFNDIRSMRLTSTGEIRGFVRGDGTNDIDFQGGSIATDEWSHVALTWDGSRAGLYVDGSQVNELTGQSNVGTISTGLKSIGRTHDPRYFHGIICDARTYNRALSDAKLQSLVDWGSKDYAVTTSDGGIMYYDFTDNSATDRYNSFDGTINGPTYQSAAGPRNEGAFDFDGTDDYISFGSSNTLTPDTMTLSIWINPDSFPDRQVPAGKDDETDGRSWTVELTGSNNDRPVVNFFDSTESDIGNDGRPIPAGAWSHIVGTHANGITHLYQNGEHTQKATGGDGVIGDSSSDARLGMRVYDTAQDHFDGKIGAFRLYDRVLDPHEVQELYQFGTRGRDLRHFASGAV